MSNNKSQLLSLAATVGVVALLYGLDTLTVSWHRRVFASFNAQPFQIYTMLVPVLFAALILFLAWLLLVRIRQGWPMQVFGLLAGALLVGTGVLIATGSPAVLPFINLPLLGWLRTAIFDLGAASLTFQAGAFIFVIALVNMARRQR